MYTRKSKYVQVVFRRHCHPPSSCVCSELIVAVLRNVADPWQRLVAALFNNLQISNLDTAHGEIWNFKFDLGRDLNISRFQRLMLH